MPKARGKKIRQPALEQTLIQTYQCRPPLDAPAEAFLDDCAQLFSRIEHSLFADMVRLGIAVAPKTDSSKKTGGTKKKAAPKTTSTGKKAPSTNPAAVLKRDYLTREQITSRQYNAILARIKGQVSSIVERRPGLIEELEGRIETQKRQIKNVEKRIAAATSRKVIANGKDERHNRRRKLANMEYRLAQLEADEANHKVRLCFGSKKLFLAQYHLEDNHFETHADWKTARQAASCCQVYFIGSMDETNGNQTAQFHVSGDHLLTLTLRVPGKLRTRYGNFLVISNIRVEYGFDAIVAALEECRLRGRLKSRKNASYKEHGQAISVRFEKDAKGWRLLIATGLARPEIVTSKKHGVFGVALIVIRKDTSGCPLVIDYCAGVVDGAAEFVFASAGCWPPLETLPETGIALAGATDVLGSDAFIAWAMGGLLRLELEALAAAMLTVLTISGPCLPLNKRAAHSTSKPKVWGWSSGARN